MSTMLAMSTCRSCGYIFECGASVTTSVREQEPVYASGLDYFSSVFSQIGYDHLDGCMLYTDMSTCVHNLEHCTAVCL